MLDELNGILGLVRGGHQLYNSGDPNYYQNMGHSPYGMMGGYGGNNYGSGDSTFGKVVNGLGSVLNTVAPLVHQYRNYGRNKAMASGMYHGGQRSNGMSYPIRSYGGRPMFNSNTSNLHHNLPPMQRNTQRYSFDNPSPQVRAEQQRELDYWNQKKELDHWNNQRDMQSANPVTANSPFTPEHTGPSMYYQGETGEDKAFAKGGPAKQYYVREKMPGYDVGRVVPHLLANYWNPRLDPAGVAGNLIGGEAARGLGNYGINRLMGTDGYRWSDPRELTRAERFGRFFTHRIPKTINKTFGTNLDTGHGKYWNAAKGLPPAIRNNPGLLEQGVGALGNKALNLGSKVHEGIKGLGGVAYNKMDNMIPQIQDMGSRAYNTIPEVKNPIEQRVNHAASSISPFSRSGVSPWDMDPNFKEEQKEQAPSYLSQMYNSLPNWQGLGSIFTGKIQPSSNPARQAEHIQSGMKDFYPRSRKESATDQFMNKMLNSPYAHNNSGMNEGLEDEFFDARDEYDPSYHAGVGNYARGGYTGNLAPDEFVHRRHHRVEEPNNLDQMIRAYIAHMMEQQRESGGAE